MKCFNVNMKEDTSTLDPNLCQEPLESLSERLIATKSPARPYRRQDV